MIERVELENWKSHHETELEFESGVNALVGTMGSGKSSVLEAIVFAFFGTTPAHNSREITLDDLVRRTPSKADMARVRVEFEIGGESYSVERKVERGEGTERSELRRDGELLEAPSTTEVTEQVEKVLGLDFKSFSRAIYSEQNSLDLFLNMRPGERKERIDELLDIDRLEQARKNTVKMENSLEKQLEQRQEELSGLEEEVEEEKVEKLEEKLEEMSEKIEKLEEELSGKTEILEEKEEKKQEIAEKKEKVEKLREKKTRLEAKKESIQERIEEAEQKLEGYESPGKQLEEARKKKEELEKKKEELNRLEENRKHLSERVEELDQEIDELEDQREKYQEIDDIEEKIENIDGELEEIKKEGNSRHAERSRLEESVETLRDSEGECPTCGKELDSDHRKELVERRRERIEELKKEENRLKEKLEKKQGKKEKLEDRRDKLLEYRSAEEKLEEKKEELDEKKEDLQELEKRIEKLDEKVSGEKIEELDRKIEILEHHEEKEELDEKAGRLEERIETVDEKLGEIDFDEEELDRLRQEISGLKEDISAGREKVGSRRKLLEEKEKRLEQMRERLDEKRELEKEVEELDRMLDYVNSYRHGLMETQVELRQKFVERLNQLMDSIWKQVYPYDDYYSMRLNAEEDYLVEVLDSEDNWISAQAEVSGGERHSAALVMRLGLAFTLSPSLEVLMLDEPTHNMDSSAVEKLSETLRENSSELLDQLFVVTHDPSLESAATGKLYRFEKKNTDTGLTKVEEVE